MAMNTTNNMSAINANVEAKKSVALEAMTSVTEKVTAYLENDDYNAYGEAIMSNNRRHAILSEILQDYMSPEDYKNALDFASQIDNADGADAALQYLAWEVARYLSFHHWMSDGTNALDEAGVIQGVIMYLLGSFSREKLNKKINQLFEVYLQQETIDATKKAPNVEVGVVTIHQLLAGNDTDGDFLGLCKAIDAAKEEAPNANIGELINKQTIEEWLADEDEGQEYKSLIHISVDVRGNTIAMTVSQSGNEYTAAWEELYLYPTSDDGWKALMTEIADFKRLYFVSEDWHYPEEYSREEPMFMGGFGPAPLPYKEDVSF